MAEAVEAGDVPQLARRASHLARNHQPAIIGLAGEPGSGKSYLATRIVREVSCLGVTAVLLPMDGFHLGNDVLDHLGLAAWKGRIDTFDGWGFYRTLQRIYQGGDPAVYAPGFHRDLEQPLAAAIRIPADAQVVLVEGNYLLDAASPWSDARALMTETWFLEVPDGVRVQRLSNRHVQYGKSAAAARQWVQRVDDPNAARVRQAAASANLIIRG